MQVKCNCEKTVREKLMKAMPDATNIIMPIEMLSGKFYIGVEKVVIKNGKTKRTQVPITLSRCPFCGIEHRKIEVCE